MTSSWKVGGGMLALVLGVGLALTLQPDRSAAQKDAGKGTYSVISTDGTHLVVTDNKTNKVYFYSIDQGGKPGDELKFRGTINLEDVGKPSIQPTKPK